MLLFSSLRSRLLRPVFLTLCAAVLVQMLVALALTRGTIDGLEQEIEQSLGADSARLLQALRTADTEVSRGLSSLAERMTGDLSQGLTQQLTEEQQKETGVTKDLIRLSVGLEDLDDLKADLREAFSKIKKQVLA